MLRRLGRTVLSCFLSVDESWRLVDPKFCGRRQWYARPFWCSSGISLMRVLKWMVCGKNVLAEHIIQHKHVPMWKFKILHESRLSENKLKMYIESRRPQGQSSHCHPSLKKVWNSSPAEINIFGSSALLPENTSTATWFSIGFGIDVELLICQR